MRSRKCWSVAVAVVCVTAVALTAVDVVFVAEAARTRLPCQGPWWP